MKMRWESWSGPRGGGRTEVPVRLAAGLLLAFSLQIVAAQTTPNAEAMPPPPQTQPPAAVSAPARKEDARYRIGPGDVLDIRYYNRPQLSRESVRVDGYGMIRMPLVDGEIKAACLTESELSAEIAARYLKYYRNPHVDVFIKDYQAEPVAVIGAVNKPGRFQLQRRVRLLELIAFADGPSERAGETIQVVHSASSSVCDASGQVAEPDVGHTLVSYKLSDTLQGDGQSNPFVRPGDVITLLEAEQVYVVGNVHTPRTIPLKEPLTVSRAIAMAGGTLRDTKSDRVRIIRQTPGSAGKQEIYVSLKAIDRNKAQDVALQPNDIVDVPVSGAKGFMRSLLGTVAPALSQLPVRVVP